MDAVLRCCCGSPNCAFLAHNSDVLEKVECKLVEAGRMGQALLERHENYIAESERERRQMAATIESLEKEKYDLEQRNAETIQANRDLLDQLEQLNVAVANSDAEIQSLTDALHSTEEEIERLSSLAARTQSLERQIIELEREQSLLQGNLDLKVGDERTAIQRWHRAEQTIGNLHDQIDRIETEARQERERHVEIVARMERRMAVDGELAKAAGRLKAKAGEEMAKTNVVSHFVKDILHDNANLQHGILELREMLQNSNEEVERLRDQLQMHQPLSSPDKEPVSMSMSVPLSKELEVEPVLNQELHIHHHYHGPKPRKEGIKAQVPRRPRKKRISLTPGHYPTSVPPDASSAATILSQTSVTVPPSMQRWSNATTLAPSSAPGSPYSMSYRGSIYDRVFSDVAYDSSRPTSPSDSINPFSPIVEPVQPSEIRETRDHVHRHQKRKSQSLKPPSLSTIRSHSAPIALITKSSPANAIISSASPPDSLCNDIFLLSPLIDSAIAEEEEDRSTPDAQSLNPPASTSEFSLEDVLSPTIQNRPNLRRAASHESLISVSGMDIHTLQSRPSQLLFSTPSHLSSPTPGTSPQPVLTPWTATATASLSRQTLDSSAFNRSLLYGSIVNQKRGVPTTQKPRPSAGLGKKVGGWVLGKWGASPTSSSPTLRHSKSSDQCGETLGDTVKAKPDMITTTPSTTKRPEVTTKDSATPPTADMKRTDTKPTEPVKFRAPGINQSGPIWGFFDIPPTPSQVKPANLDAEALGDALAELS